MLCLTHQLLTGQQYRDTDDTNTITTIIEEQGDQEVS